MAYGYRSAMKDDIEDFLDNYLEEYLDKCSDKDELYEKLNDDLWIEDSVTGNGSGSYTFNRAKAREYVAGNEGLVVDAMEEFGCQAEDYKRAFTDPEYCDVTIRCWLLGDVLVEVLDEYERAGKLNFPVESDNRRPKAKGKAPTKKGTNKPPVKKKPTTSRKPSVKANKDGSASIRSLKKIQSKRSPAAVKADERKKAKNTIHKKTKTGYKSVSMSDAKKWARSPGSMDIQGVDTKPKYPKRRN